MSLKSLPKDLKDAESFIENLHAVYGAVAAQAIVAQLGQESAHAFWVNPLREVRDIRSLLPAGSQPVTGLAEVWQVPRDSGLTSADAAVNGDIYVQNPSSTFAARVLEPRCDEEILDLAAAPGGKTICIAGMMRNTGRLAAVEPVKGRFHRLRANVARCGVTNVEFYQRDGRGVGRAVGERFDRVLLDAPCSSEARMRWFAPASYQHWSVRKVRESQRKQKSLLRSAYAALKPGGRLVYCTCSFSVQENELVVQHLLDRTDARVEPISLHPGNRIAGVTAFNGRSLAEDLVHTLRIVPDSVWDGFYIAALRKPLA